MRLLANYPEAMRATECPISCLAKYKHISVLGSAEAFSRGRHARFRDNDVRECDVVVESRAFFVAELGTEVL